MEDVIHDIQVIEEDVKDVEQKCEKINCLAVYDAIVATIKLIYDILHGPQPARENDRERFELLGIIL